MSGKQVIDPQSLSQASKSLTTGHTEITSQLGTVTKSVNALYANWDGATKAAFDEFYKNYKKGMDTALLGLTDMSTFLNNYTTAMTDIDTKHASALK